MDAATPSVPQPVCPVPGGSFEVPPRAGATPALACLLGQDIAASDEGWEDRLVQSRLGAVSSLFRALRLKHPPTAKHCLRVSLGCSVLAKAINLDDIQRSQIEIAALLHDIGKIGVPDHILNKPSRLDVDEVALMERHRLFGRQIIEASCSDRDILDIVAHASTWFDGTRPSGNTLTGEEIPVGARVVAILDAFDSMTTDLVYRNALPRERAVAELFENSPSQFDPELVIAFSEAFTAKDSPFDAEVTRRWVETACNSAEELGAIESPLFNVQGDARAIFQQRLLEAMHDGVVFVDLSGRILVWNRGAERLTGLSTESVHHKTWQPQLIDMRDMEGNAIKPRNCPLTQCLRSFSQGMHRMTITNESGQVAVNVHVVPVRDISGGCHGATMLLHDVSPEQSLEQRVQNLHERATTDPLTQVGNRAEFDRRHQDLVKNHLETGAPCSLIISDIDRFKSINDRYGHQAGDEALIEFAKLIQRHCRGQDVVARYGGEEFVLLCPNCTNEAATRKAEEIRRELAQTPQAALNQQHMTASFGVTELQPGDSPETMLRRADRALYQAKETGRDRVIQLGSGMNDNRSKKRTSWFSWSRKSEDFLVRRVLKSNVPLKVVAEKVRGFVSDHGAEIVEIRECFVVLCVDERHIPMQRRQTDRPTSLTIELELKPQVTPSPTPTSATLIEVTIRPKRSRDRRSDAAARADQLLNSLKSYLIAEEC